ncbi:MAG: UDP-2,4-diacetamido-2,4,6-trideoxy-beta-L-altropyranose hydrolase [Aureispira sp.]
MSRSVVYFRADGNSQIGLGHVYRSLALVDMLQADFECIFLIRTPSRSLVTMIEKRCKVVALPASTSNSEETNFIAQKYLTGNEIVVLDGYHFDTAYQTTLKHTGIQLVCIDDIYAYHFVADVLINHAGGVQEEWYSKETYTMCCFGLEYALLQAPFLSYAQTKQPQSVSIDSTNMFLCLGGADPNNDILQILKELEQQLITSKLYLVLGGAYQHHSTLDEFIKQTTLSIQKLQNLDTSEMLFYMQQCGIGIVSPSTISFEFLSTGGLLYLVQTASNQEGIFNYFIKESLAFDWKEDYPVVTTSSRVAQALKKQKQYFSGGSANNLRTVFKKIALC